MADTPATTSDTNDSDPAPTDSAVDLSDSDSSSEKTAPLKRCVTIEEVGNTAAFLCSDLASGITGEITYVDGGYNIYSSVQMSDDE